ncbi:MAG: hypothetical protein WAO00_13410 [Chthoniobacterales bacterium]
MSYDQLYVTSCQRGVTGGSGFQTLAMSLGVQSAERAQIEGLVGYVKPNGSPDDPTGQELVTSFPVNFGYAILVSGRWCLFQSVFVELDHNKRRGNYFAHVILGTPSTLPELPHRYWQSLTFVRSAKEVEEHVVRTGDCSLPTLDADALLPGKPLSLETNDSSAMLADMLVALCCSPTSGRRVVLAASPEQAISWYARITEALPTRWAWEVTFCTYARDPVGLKTHLHLAAVECGQGPFGFTSTDRDYTSYVFDFEKQYFSRLPALGWHRSPSLDALAEDAGLPQSESEVRGALAFAAMTAMPAIVPTGIAAGEAAAYLIARYREERLPTLRQRWASVDELANEISIADAPAHLQAMAALAKAENSPAAWESVGQAARSVLQRLVFAEQKGWQEALGAALDAAGDAAPKIARALLHEDFFSDAKEFLNGSNTGARGAADVCSFVLRVLVGLGSEATASAEEGVIAVVHQSLPALREQAGTLGPLMRMVPAAIQVRLLARALQRDDVSMNWLVSEMSWSWGSEPTDSFVSMALSSPALLGAPFFASFLYAVMAGELTGSTAMKRYERIVKLLKQHPEQLQLAQVHPRLFALITGLKPDHIPEVCRDYLQAPPSSDADLGPVLDQLECHINLANPPKWLSGKVVDKLWRQRQAWPTEGTRISVIGCVAAMQLMAAGTPVAEVRRQHLDFHAALAALPVDAWENVAGTCARQFAQQQSLPAECAAFLQMMGGAVPARIALTAAWVAEAQLPSLLGRGNLPALHALLHASLVYSWPEATAKALRNALTPVLAAAKNSTLKRLRDLSLSSRVPAVLTFFENLPKRDGRFSGMMHKFIGK